MQTLYSSKNKDFGYKPQDLYTEILRESDFSIRQYDFSKGLYNLSSESINLHDISDDPTLYIAYRRHLKIFHDMHFLRSIFTQFLCNILSMGPIIDETTQTKLIQLNWQFCKELVKLCLPAQTPECRFVLRDHLTAADLTPTSVVLKSDEPIVEIVDPDSFEFKSHASFIFCGALFTVIRDMAEISSITYTDTHSDWDSISLNDFILNILRDELPGKSADDFATLQKKALDVANKIENQLSGTAVWGRNSFSSENVKRYLLSLENKTNISHDIPTIVTKEEADTLWNYYIVKEEAESYRKRLTNTMNDIQSERFFNRKLSGKTSLQSTSDKSGGKAIRGGFTVIDTCSERTFHYLSAPFEGNCVVKTSKTSTSFKQLRVQKAEKARFAVFSSAIHRFCPTWDENHIRQFRRACGQFKFSARKLGRINNPFAKDIKKDYSPHTKGSHDQGFSQDMYLDFMFVAPLVFVSFSEHPNLARFANIYTKIEFPKRYEEGQPEDEASPWHIFELSRQILWVTDIHEIIFDFWLDALMDNSSLWTIKGKSSARMIIKFFDREDIAELNNVLFYSWYVACIENAAHLPPHSLLIIMPR